MLPWTKRRNPPPPDLSIIASLPADRGGRFGGKGRAYSVRDGERSGGTEVHRPRSLARRARSISRAMFRRFCRR